MEEVQNIQNNSGQKDAVVPEAIAKKFNWGAFLLNWIWGLGNNTYITLFIFLASILAFIPFIGGFIPLGLCIWFGIKGNEWAWQNKQWDSIEHFNSVQKIWAIVGLVLAIVGFILGFLFFTVIVAAIAAGAAAK